MVLYYSVINSPVALLESLLACKLEPLSADWELLAKNASQLCANIQVWADDVRIYELRSHHRSSMCRNTVSQFQHCQIFSFFWFVSIWFPGRSKSDQTPERLATSRDAMPMTSVYFAFVFALRSLALGTHPNSPVSLLLQQSRALGLHAPALFNAVVLVLMCPISHTCLSPLRALSLPIWLSSSFSLSLVCFLEHTPNLHPEPILQLATLLWGSSATEKISFFEGV